MNELNGAFGDDFFERWVQFNRMLNENRKNHNDMGLDINELIRIIKESRENENEQNRFRHLDKNDLNIPDEDLNSQEGTDDNGKWETKNWSSPDGSIFFSSFSRSSNPEDMNDIPDEIANEWASSLRNRRNKSTIEEVKKFRLDRLQRLLDEFVEEEQYERASEVKKLIDDLTKKNKED